MAAEQQSNDSVSADYFARRGLRRYAGVASLWALGMIWFALVGQNSLVKAPEEAFAIEASRR
jgi:hypothetical protein